MYSKSSWDGSLYGYLWIEYRGEQWREEKGVGVGGRDGRGCGGMDMVEGKSSFLVLSESLPGLGMKSRFRGGGGGRTFRLSSSLSSLQLQETFLRIARGESKGEDDKGSQSLGTVRENLLKLC